MAAERTVCAAFAGIALRAAERVGMGPEEFLARTGLNRAQCDDPRARISVNQQLRVNAVNLIIAGASGWPGAVLARDRLVRMGGWFPLHVVSWLNARSAREGVEAYASQLGLLLGCDRLLVRRSDEAVQLEFVAYGPQHLGAWRAISAFRTVLALIGEYGILDTSRVRLGLRAISDLRGACEGGMQVALGQATNVLELPRRELEAPNLRHDAVMARIMARRLAVELAEWGRGDGVAREARRVLSRAIERPACPAPGEAGALVCDGLGMSLPELSQALASEGTSVQALWTSVRLDEARRLLLETPLGVTEISERLGFTRQSAFTKFFTRRAGASPRAYRRRPRP